MAHTLSWYVADQVLHLVLEQQPLPTDLQDINRSVTEYLDNSPSDLYILIDTTQLVVDHKTADTLRETLEFMNHPRLHTAIFVSKHKLNRLVILMAFCRAQARSKQFPNLQEAEDFLEMVIESRTN